MKNKEAVVSQFQYQTPVITSWNFIVNNDYDSLDINGVNMPIQYTVSKRREKYIGNVTLKLSIGETNKNMPFYLETTISVMLKWDDSLMEHVDQLLQENAVTLLLSYLRPVIAQFTSYAGLAPFNLPFLDVRGSIEK